MADQPTSRDLTSEEELNAIQRIIVGPALGQVLRRLKALEEQLQQKDEALADLQQQVEQLGAQLTRQQLQQKALGQQLKSLGEGMMEE